MAWHIAADDETGEVVDIKSNPINIVSGLVEIINSKYKLLRAGAYCIFQ